jgi:UDP-glucuronate 4-epimerase
MTTKTKKTIIITGAAGFIGSHLSEDLIDLGWKVVGIDNFNNFYSPAIKRRNIKELQTKRAFKLIKGDIRNKKVLDQAFASKPDAVMHLAAMAGVRPSMEQPELYQKVNIEGTLGLLEACRKNKTDHFVFGSSSSVYGNSSRVPFKEDDPATDPISVYAATKRAGELLCNTYNSAYGMKITMLRFFTVFGPRQRPDLAIHKFARLMLANKPIPFFGDGSMERDYTYVKDITAGVIRSLSKPKGLRTFNLGSDRPVRLDKLVEAIENAVGCKARLKKMKPPTGDVRRTWSDLTHSNHYLGYKPTTSLEEGLSKFVDWLRTEGDKTCKA